MINPNFENRNSSAFFNLYRDVPKIFSDSDNDDSSLDDIDENDEDHENIKVID